MSFDEPVPAAPFPSPDVSPIRFDAVEFTFPGVANLSAVDMLGIPLHLATVDAQGRVVSEKK